MDAIPKKPSPRKAIPEKEAEVENEPLSLRELSGYADTFCMSFSVQKLYDEFVKDKNGRILLPDGSTHVSNYSYFIRVITTYLRIREKGGLKEAKQLTDDFLNEKRAELATNRRKNELVNLILLRAHKLGESGYYKNYSVKELEEILRMLSTLPIPTTSMPTPNTSDPQMINGQINPANCAELIFNSEDWIVGVILDKTISYE